MLDAEFTTDIPSDAPLFMEALRFADSVRQLREGLGLTQMVKSAILHDGSICYVVDLQEQRRVHVANEI